MNDKVNKIIINYINEYLSNKDNINFEEIKKFGQGLN